MDQPTFRTEPVSYSRRGGRLNDRQQAAWDKVASTMVVEVPRFGSDTSVDPDFRLDVEQTFGRSAPLIVEIGSGRGEALVGAAQAHPDANVLGLEVYVPGVAQTLVTLRHERISNVRLAIVNAAEALSTMLEPASVTELRLWFPDPWHKTRHHKRRLITDSFAHLASRVLVPSGVWRMATDWADYADQMSAVIAHSPEFEGGPTERFSERPLTRFEAKGLNVDRVIHDFSATHVPTKVAP